MSRFSVKISSHSDKKIRRGTLLRCVSEKFRQPKSLWIRGEGSIKSFRRKRLSDCAEKFRMGTFQCVIFLSIENLSPSEGYVTIFCRSSLSDSDKRTCRGTLLRCVSENFRQRKSLQKGKRRKYQDFPSKFFSSHSVEKCCRGFLQSFNNFSYGESLEEKVRGEKYQDFPLKVSCLTVPKRSVAEAFYAVFQKSSRSKKMEKKGERGNIKVFRRKFFV